MLALIRCRQLKELAGNVAQRMYCSKNGHESVGRVAHWELSKKLITQKKCGEKWCEKLGLRNE